MGLWNKISPAYQSTSIKPKVGFLFLTRAGLNCPKIWEDYFSTAPGRTRVFSHIKTQEKISDPILSGTEILNQCAPHHRWRAGGAPGVPKGCWKFSPQWWLFDRVTAHIASGSDYTSFFSKAPIPDEGYFATVLSMQGYPLDVNVVRKPSTWTHWEPFAGSPKTWSRIEAATVREIVQSGAFFARKFAPDSNIGDYKLHL